MTLPVVVLSCDRYRFVWEPWYCCWKENFSKQLGPYYFVTGNIPADMTGIQSILTHTDDWTLSARTAVNQVNADRFLLCLDDFLFGDFARSFDFEQIPDGEIVGIHPNSSLYTSSVIGRACGYYDLRKMDIQSNYKTSLQPTVWDRKTFLSLLKENESPWDFETRGNARAMRLAKTRTFVDVAWYTHAVKRGHWLPEGLRLADKCGWKR